MKFFTLTFIAALALAGCNSNKTPITGATPRYEISEGDTVRLDGGIRFVYTKMSDDTTSIVPGNYVNTHINLSIADKLVWSTYQPLRPFGFQYKGNPPMISGFDEVIQYMKKGDRILAIIPPELGYGPSGNGPDIPPNSILHFDIEVLEVR